jgi:hypothetical protein
MSQHEQEGAIARSLLEPIDCQVSDARGVITLKDTLFAIDIERRIEIHSLPLMACPIIEAGTRIITVFVHVPLPDIGCFVARGLELERETLQIFRVIGEIIRDTVLVCI